MLSREELRRLAEVESSENCAVSFYYQPETPQDKSHKGESILVKDLVKNALRQAERAGGNGVARADLQRILELAEHLHGNHARAKAIFACAKNNIWREVDLPPRLSRSELFVNARFQLRPLVTLLQTGPRCLVTLLDREKARFFDYWLGDIVELTARVDFLPRRGRSDGFMGYDAGHNERHVENEELRHLKAVAEQMRECVATGNFRAVIVGCREETWAELEPQLHSYVRQRLMGRFAIDPAVASAEQVRTEAARLVAETRQERHQGMIREALGEAQRDGRGAAGLRHVLTALERGEVQTILIGRGFSATAIECPQCGHLDTRMVKDCALCGKPTRELHDVTDALIARAVRGGADLVEVDDPEFARAGNIAALLRFRADQSTARKLAI